MKTNLTRRSAFSVAAAVTTVAMAALPAAAALNAPDVFSGAANAHALTLELDAPADVLGLLGQDQVNVGVSLTDVTTASQGAASAAATLLDTPLGLVENLSSDSGESSGSYQLAAQEIGPISIGAGTMSYAIDGATNAVQSASELAYLKVGLPVALPQVPAVGDVVDTVTSEVEALVSDIVGELNGVLDEVEQTLQDTAGLPIDIPEVPVADVLDDVLASASSLDGTLVEVRKLWSESSVTPIDGVVRSTAVAGIVGADILDGAISIPEFSYSAWAQAGGAPGTADAGFATQNLVLEVLGNEIINLNNGTLTVAGTTLDLNDPMLVGTGVQDLIDPVSDLVNDLLNTAGLDYSLGEGVTEISPDGTYASATVSAFSLSLAPLHAATALPELDGLVQSLGLASADDLLHLKLNLLPVTASARAQQALVVPAAPSLPRTGGGAAVLGLMGLAGAGVLRRKF